MERYILSDVKTTIQMRETNIEDFYIDIYKLKVDKEKIKKALEDFFSTGTKKLDDIEAELNKQNATMYPNKKISEEKNRILDIFSKIL